MAAAGAVGRSRWGERELEKITSMIANGLEESESTSGSHSLPLVLSDLRNGAVIAAAVAGKSRWGEKEINRITTLQKDLVVNGDLGRIPWM